jgi:hypothetical protein
VRRSNYAADRHVTRLRACVLLIWVTIAICTPYEYYALLPEQAFRAYGLGHFLFADDTIRGLLLHWQVLLTLKWVVIVGSLVATVAPERWLMSCVCVAVVILDLVTKAAGGYANHAQAAPLFMLILLTTIGTASTRSSDHVACKGQYGVEARAGSAATVWLAQLLLIVPYTYIGVNRLADGGAALFVGGDFRSYLSYTNHLYSAFGLSGTFPWLEWESLDGWWRAGFFVTTLLEVSSVGAAGSHLFRRIWLVGMSAVHVWILVAMNIVFWENLVLIWVVFGPLPAQHRFARELWHSVARRQAPRRDIEASAELL